jgi:uncharacterized protein
MFGSAGARMPVVVQGQVRGTLSRVHSTSGRHFLIAGLLLLTAFPAFAQRGGLPAPQGRVTDLAGVLSEPAKQQALTRIREVEAATTAEIGVATVPSLDGMGVEEYANRLFHEWGIGKRERDNGVLILVAPNDRKVRIEVGYGLEPILPDGLAGEIVRRDVLPQFRSNNYEAGILAAVNRVAEIVEKNETVTPEERRRLANANRDPHDPGPMLIVMLGSFAVVGAFAIGTALRSRSFIPLLFGVPFGVFPAAIGVTAFHASLPLFAGLGLFGAALGFILVGKLRGNDRWRYRSSDVRLRDSKGNWTMPVPDSSSSSSSSSWSSSDSSSSSSSSSDSGFGGGDSGGGGASGSW